MDILKLRNKLTNEHGLTIEECEYLKSLIDMESGPATPSNATMEAAREICRMFSGDSWQGDPQSVQDVAAIISRCLQSAGIVNDGP